eukprot:TRINITY_DN8461_c0_g1_i1.p1 TRINITY_DN8461_c0_g1~~TRINITY_DN8461_c0_g1_i1.p1  ORF type:complete len:200 (+),score=24.57 TRINITY_DN8461_c0_g1_i1:34-600(+)
MTHGVIWFVLLLAQTLLASGEVKNLKKENFDDVVRYGNSDTWLVEFFAPWCGHCKRLAPTWETLGDSAQQFKVGKVDCVAQKILCKRFGVSRYPTIRLIKDNKLYNYDSKRTLEGFLAFGNGGYTSQDSNTVPQPGETVPDALSIIPGPWMLIVLLLIAIMVPALIFLYIYTSYKEPALRGPSVKRDV